VFFSVYAHVSHKRDNAKVPISPKDGPTMPVENSKQSVRPMPKYLGLTECIAT